MHPFIKVPAIVGTVITVALLIASAFAGSDIPWLVAIGTFASSVLAFVSQFIVVRKLGISARR